MSNDSMTATLTLRVPVVPVAAAMMTALHFWRAKHRVHGPR